MNFKPEGKLFDTKENSERISTQEGIRATIGNDEILEARAVICDSQHNLIVDLGGMRGLIPRECGAIGIIEGFTRDIALISRVSRPVSFVVKDIRTDENGNEYALLSRRHAQELCMNNYISKLVPGDVIPARITHIESFGAFCDIGCGIIALLPIDSISVSRISHPSDRFTASEDIMVVVKSRDDLGRITLTHKELLGTWEDNVANLCSGETITGIVRSVEEYGIFVELSPNLAGLTEPHPNVKPAQQASVFIKSINPEKMKIKLIIIDTHNEPIVASKTKYYINSGHISHFRYSPSQCEKVIETVFD